MGTAESDMEPCGLPRSHSDRPATLDKRPVLSTGRGRRRRRRLAAAAALAESPMGPPDPSGGCLFIQDFLLPPATLPRRLPGRASLPRGARTPIRVRG